MFHVRHNKLIGEPFTVVASICRHFGLTMSDQAEHAIQREIQERPNGGYGRNRYRFEDYGIDSAAVRHQYDSYVDYFRTKVGSVAPVAYQETPAQLIAS
jgi:hypothetical protein